MGAKMSFNKLTWGVKASFRNYVEAAGGSITVSDGATRADDGAIIFEAEPGGDLAIAPDGSASGSLRLQGTVTFEAHGGMLKSTLTGLALEAAEEGLMLTVVDSLMNENRCAIAKLGPVISGSGDNMTLRSEITIDGMYQIADNYPPGTELDPLTLE
mgnify:CR=1 FL=1|tara:strand:- start:500 stop:970 length:471 start_codon:yes stop_codon:yes gene_type:complete